jgi:FkbH-like protein
MKVLDHSGYFEVTTLSSEDFRKTEMYHAKAEAGKAMAAFADYGAYLDSLQMTAYIDDFKPIYVQRIAQLTNKSNQFNLTTLRCTEDDIRGMQDSAEHICLCGRLSDRFADNGLVTVVIAEQEDTVLSIKLWLMSCRVLKREMEEAMMNALVEQARKKGIDRMIGYYYPTEKNRMVKDFYGSMGFSKLTEDANGNTAWELNVSGYTERKPHMLIVNQL